MSQEFSRRDFLRMAGLGMAGLGLAGSLEGCQSREQNPSSETLPELVNQPETLGVARGSVLLGLMPDLDDTSSQSRIGALDQRLKKWKAAFPQPQIISFFEAMYGSQVPAELLQSVFEKGSLPVINLYFQDGAGSESLFRFAEIEQHEAYFRRLAQVWRDFGEPIFLRPAYEMNLSPDPTNGWFPRYGIRPDNTPQNFIDAWVYVRRLFREEGTNNVLWVFSPNIATLPGQLETLKQCCPPPEAVDIVALDGYDRYKVVSEEAAVAMQAMDWQNVSKKDLVSLAKAILKSTCQAVVFPDLSFGELFGPSLNILKEKYPDKPLWISEIGSGRHNRGWWLAQAIQEAIFKWGIKGFSFFEYNKKKGHFWIEDDWRLTDKPLVVEHLRPYLDQPAFCPAASLELIKPILEKQLNHELQ